MNPITQFTDWLNDAKACATITEPTAMTLATATAEGVPSARIVLLKAHGEEGFTFFTNLNSRKSGELRANPRAALCFYWMPLERQVRIEGRIEPIAEAEADAYFASRPRGRQIGAWASQQSEPLAAPELLHAGAAEIEARFAGQEIPRPPHWSGWRLVPRSIEFWVQNNDRLHAREMYTHNAEGGWTQGWLYP